MDEEIKEEESESIDSSLIFVKDNFEANLDQINDNTSQLLVRKITPTLHGTVY
jgi:hypothetical protein